MNILNDLYKETLQNYSYLVSKGLVTSIISKYHYIYKVTNKKSGRFYIGRRSTNTQPHLDDYMGSGVALLASYKVNGKDSFIKEIIHHCDSFEELCALERVLVDRSFINKSSNYNLSEGGLGFGGVSDITRKKMSSSKKGIKFTKERKSNISKSLTGRLLKESTKIKMSESRKRENLKESTIEKCQNLKRSC